MENAAEWHGNAPDEALYETARRELYDAYVRAKEARA